MVMGDMPPPLPPLGPRYPPGPFCIPLSTSSKPISASCHADVTLVDVVLARGSHLDMVGIRQYRQAGRATFGMWIALNSTVLIPVGWTHSLSVVMPGHSLRRRAKRPAVPGTHVFRATKQGVGGRGKPGHDAAGAST